MVVVKEDDDRNALCGNDSEPLFKLQKHHLLFDSTSWCWVKKLEEEKEMYTDSVNFTGPSLSLVSYL